jgi:N-acetylmuramoyl-L-alanine amidase
MTNLRKGGRVVVRWCNGSTRPFGGFCPGSNPGRTANPSPKRNAPCYDYKLVVNKPVRKIVPVHQVSIFLTLALVVSLLPGCQTALQRPVAIQTQVLAPDIEVAPASSVEVAIVDVPAPVAPPLRPVSTKGVWPSNWVNTWVPLQGWGKFNEAVSFSRTGGDSTHPTYRLQTPHGTFSVKVGSRSAEYDWLGIWLGFAPQFIGGAPYVHWLDAQKTLQPLVDRGSYCFDNGRTIVIDAGHGGRDNGATGLSGARHEKDYTLDWALRLQRLLRTNGWNVIMTRQSDVDLSLTERVNIADQAKADFFLSLHFNSGSANRELSGIETYCLTPVGMPSHLTRDYEDDVRQVFPNNTFDEQNMRAAVRLHGVILQASGAQDRGVRRARFMTVLRGQNRPAVLVEGGYLTNPAEAQRIASAAYRQTLAEALARGLELPE